MKMNNAIQKIVAGTINNTEVVVVVNHHSDKALNK